ncbi:unnamed protein product [Boreogadus saida]
MCQNIDQSHHYFKFNIFARPNRTLFFERCTGNHRVLTDATLDSRRLKQKKQKTKSSTTE